MAVQQYLMMGRGGTDRNIITGEQWAVGYNGTANLGVGDDTNCSVPEQVGSATTWQNTMQPEGYGSGSALAVQSDGTLWGWGRNLKGALGFGNTTYTVTPTQVGSDTDWKEATVYSDNSAAIKTDGTLWTWGEGYEGKQGHGDTTDRSSPVQVGSETDWTHLVGINEHMTIALKTDGTLWWAGKNTALLNSPLSSMTQIGSETDIVDAIGSSLGTGFIVFWKEA